MSSASSYEAVLAQVANLSVADRKRLKIAINSDEFFQNDDSVKGDWVRQADTISTMLIAASPQSAGELMEQMLAWTLLYRCAVKGDEHFPFLDDMYDESWISTNFKDDEKKCENMSKFVLNSDYSLVAQGFKNIDSEQFISFLSDRDATNIVRPNNRGPGPDLAMWIGPDALIVIGIKTSVTTHVLPSIQEKNYRSTDPNHWWATNGSPSPEAKAKRTRAMTALFTHATPLRLIVRVHVVLTTDSHADCFNPDEDFFRTEVITWPTPGKDPDAVSCAKVSMLDIDIDETRLLDMKLLTKSCSTSVKSAFKC